MQNKNMLNCNNIDNNFSIYNVNIFEYLCRYFIIFMLILLNNNVKCTKLLCEILEIFMLIIEQQS